MGSLLSFLHSSPRLSQIVPNSLELDPERISGKRSGHLNSLCKRNMLQIYALIVLNLLLTGVKGISLSAREASDHAQR